MSDRTPRQRLALGVTWLAITALAVAVLYVGLTLWVRAWRYHPETAQAVAGAVLALTVIGSMALIRGTPPRRHGTDNEDDDEGGGGPPPPSRPPVPRGPRGTAPDWDGFDRLRAEWERVPARR